MRRLIAPLWCVLTCAACQPAPERFDLIVRGGDVYDGLSVDPRRADVGIRGDRITAVGNLQRAVAAREINAAGAVVAPGFIDVQSRSGTTLLAEGYGESHLHQGITTVIIGDDGSPAFWSESTRDVLALRPFGVTVDWSGFDGYFDRLMQRGTTLNVATLVPPAVAHRSPGDVEAGIRRGALGASVTVDALSDPDLLEIAQIVAAHDAVLAAHLHSASGDIGGLDRLVDIAGAANARVVLYQPALTEQAAYAELVVRIRQARADGMSIATTMTPGPEPGSAPRLYWLQETGASVGTQAAAMNAEGVFARKNAQPRADAAFTTLLARYVREEKVLPLGHAIRHMTSNAASHFRLEGRGHLRVGEFADLVVFDPTAISSPVSGQARDRYATGMRHVIVNGVPVLDSDGLTGARPGRGVFGVARTSAGTNR